MNTCNFLSVSEMDVFHVFQFPKERIKGFKNVTCSIMSVRTLVSVFRLFSHGFIRWKETWVCSPSLKPVCFHTCLLLLWSRVHLRSAFIMAVQVFTTGTWCQSLIWRMQGKIYRIMYLWVGARCAWLRWVQLTVQALMNKKRTQSYTHYWGTIQQERQSRNSVWSSADTSGKQFSLVLLLEIAKKTGF